MGRLEITIFSVYACHGPLNSGMLKYRVWRHAINIILTRSRPSSILCRQKKSNN